MAGKFPGMDPWLEHPALWPSVHTRLLTYAGDELQDRLGSVYDVSIQERVYLERAERSVYPDVSVIERPQRNAVIAEQGSDRPVVLLLDDEERHEAFLETRDPRATRRA